LVGCQIPDVKFPVNSRQLSTPEVVTNCHNLKYGSVAKENMFCSVYSNVKWNPKS